MEDGLLKAKFEESYKRIQDAFKMVTKERKIEDFSLSHVLSDGSSESEVFRDFEQGAVFGFNVRLNSDDVVIPILGGQPWKDRVGKDRPKDVATSIVMQIAPDLIIPEVFKSLPDTTISFCLDENNKVVEEDGVINDTIKSQLEKSSDEKKSFAVVQQKELFGNEKVYFWISRECKSYEFSSSGGYNYLSNILVISKKKEHIDFVERHYVDFLRFLFQMEMAYATLLEKSKKVESIKSAVAAIMSRNMSHNLGSHYLYYTKNQLATLADSYDEAGPEIRGASKVMGYMQARMDYLATIVSGDKYPYGAVYFKGQLFDELTVDDFSRRHFHGGIDVISGKDNIYKRTTNFLLQNLVLSENFTRGSVLAEQNCVPKDGTKNIRLQIQYGNHTFTGGSGNNIETKEQGVKLAISSMCIALPGNVMSIHAFYNVLENLIRNSAKYHKNDFNKELVFTIRINEIMEDKVKKLPIRYEFIIFDNKANAFKPFSSEDPTPLVQRMNRELCSLQILTRNNELDKSNKGLKEMLFSTLWMRTYTYENSKHMSDILAEMDQLPVKKRMDEISQHAFEYVSVDDNGTVRETGDSLNLGIRFELPKWRKMENVEAIELKRNLIEKGLNNFTDILCVDHSYTDFATLRTKFTRVHEGIVNDVDDEKTAVEVLKGILNSRFPGFDEYRLLMDSRAEKGFTDCDKKRNGIFFKTHEADPTVMDQYAYCEAISGANFTKTMLDLFNSSFNIFGKYKDSSSEYFALKIKESALTRITLMDERFYNDMIKSGKKDVLSFKNIRVLNLNDSNDMYAEQSECSMNVKDLFDGNDFRDPRNGTHFLSIHLGMIEKIVKDESKWVKALGMETKPTNERVNDFMEWLKNTFRPEKGEVFISIHSGRGNFSPELDNSLQSYPFISISALESTYANSKFLLAQLFYNTVYIGKGVTNAGK